MHVFAYIILYIYIYIDTVDPPFAGVEIKDVHVCMRASGCVVVSNVSLIILQTESDSQFIRLQNNILKHQQL